MASARFASSSSILRSALAAHVGLSGTSLLRSALGPSQLPPPSDDAREDSTSTSCSTHQVHEGHPRQDVATISASLPWLDQLHGIVAGMYVNGGVAGRCAGLERDVLVQIGQGIAYENPAVAFAGVGEVERAFRGRLCLHPQDNVETVLECVGVEASDDSICGGNDMHHENSQNATIPATAALLGNPSKAIASNAPKVEVTYRLSQQYGKYFSVNSLLVVTVQVRRGTSQTIRNITPGGKLALPLATSGFTPRAASTLAAATSCTGPVALALSEVANNILTKAKARRRLSEAGLGAQGSSSSPLVAEVVRIEEQWNGVPLLGLAPFHWSRRLNGFVVGSAACFFFN